MRIRTKHPRLTENDATRIENSSVKTSWRELADVFSNYISEPLIKKEKQQNSEADALIPATVGYITTMAARLGENNIDTALDIINSKGARYLKKKSFTYEEKIDEKISLL